MKLGWRITIKEPQDSLSAEKVMATVYRNVDGIIRKDFLEKGKTIIEAYYMSLLDQLDDAIKE